MLQDTYTEIDWQVGSVYQDTPVTTARHINHIAASALALSVGLHLTLIAVLAQTPQHQLRGIRPSSPIMVVLIKSVPKKPVLTPVPTNKEIPKLPQPSTVIAPTQAHDKKPSVQETFKHKPEPKKPEHKIEPNKPSVQETFEHKPEPKKPEHRIEPKKPKPNKSKHKLEIKKPEHKLKRIEPEREHESQPTPKSVTRPIPKFMPKSASHPVSKSTTKTTKRSVLQHPIQHPAATPAAIPTLFTRPIRATRATSLHEPTSSNHAMQRQNPNITPAPQRREIAASSVKNSESILGHPAPRPQTGTKHATNTSGNTVPTSVSRPTSISMTYSPPTAHPAYLNNPSPAYPRAARQAHLEGRCLLEVIVNANGTPRSVRIIQGSGYSILDQAAVSAVSHWRFIPAHRGEQAVTASVEIPVRFHLSD